MSHKSHHSVRGCLKFSLVPSLVPLGSDCEISAAICRMTQFLFTQLVCFSVFGSALVPLGSDIRPQFLQARKRYVSQGVCSRLLLGMGCKSESARAHRRTK